MVFKRIIGTKLEIAVEGTAGGRQTVIRTITPDNWQYVDNVIGGHIVLIGRPQLAIKRAMNDGVLTRNKPSFRWLSPGAYTALRRHIGITPPAPSVGGDA